MGKLKEKKVFPALNQTDVLRGLENFENRRKTLEVSLVPQN